MKRLCTVVTLMLLTTAAHAGAMYSFEVGGRTISVDVSGDCDSLDCVSVSRRSAHRSNPRHVSADRASGRTASQNHTRPLIETAEQRPAKIQQAARVETPLPPKQDETPPAQSVEVPSPTPDAMGALPAAAATEPSSMTTRSVADSPEPAAATPADAKPSDPTVAKVADAAPTPPRPALAADTDAPAAVSAPKLPPTAVSSSMTPVVAPARAYYAANSQSSDTKAPALAFYAPVKPPAAAKPAAENAPSNHESPTALEGNWLADDKSSTRIKPCGPYLCGYATNSSSTEADQATLIDLKSISSTEWVGMILNRDSGVTYPAIVMLEGDKALRVRSCGMGADFCGGQVWNRQPSITAVR
jgi:uncharacterized protein (DUF2147 family)